MQSEFKMIYKGGQGEIVEKKSRFIANVRPVKTEEEAIAFVEETKKKYWDARHNCHAFVIGERQELARFSDDGEPGGTAGKPMLDVLMGEGLHNVAVVVTRYFGGTLLGTGGLVRAYSGAVKAGLADSVIINRVTGVRLNIDTDYTGLGKIQYLLGEQSIPILDSEYTDKVRIICLVPQDILGKVKADLVEGTNGKVGLEDGDPCYYAKNNGEIIILED